MLDKYQTLKNAPIEEAIIRFDIPTSHQKSFEELESLLAFYKEFNPSYESRRKIKQGDLTFQLVDQDCRSQMSSSNMGFSLESHDRPNIILDITVSRGYR